MLQTFLIFQTLLTGLTQAVPFPLAARDDYDYENLRHINKIAAIGDSYSAGIGAGNRLGDVLDPFKWGAWKCSRYDSSYPALVNNQIWGKAEGHFQFHSCSGAVTQEVIDEQVHRLDKDQDVIMVSAGGNDAELVQILNHCVFQWFSPTDLDMEIIEDAALALEQPEIAEWIQWNKDKLVRSCSEQLDITEKLINEPAFTKRIGKLIDKSKAKLRKGHGAVYYTGYARFWDEEMEDNDFCSKKENTWSFIWNKIGGPFSELAVLTKDVRQRMNSLVDLVNKKIEETVNAKQEKNENGHDRVVFVNYDRYFGDIDGRFCTKGVAKKETERIAELAFYPMNLEDPFGSVPFKRRGSTAGLAFDGTFEGDIQYMAELQMQAGQGYSDLTPVHDGPRDKDLSRRINLLPDGIGRVFHPTIAGHSIIASLILWHMTERNAKAHGQDLGPEAVQQEFGQCPLNGGDGNIDGGSPAVLYCDSPLGRMSSGLYRNVFADAQTLVGVFDGFCEELENGDDKQTNLDWTVNAKGEKQGSQKRHISGVDLQKRTPPADQLRNSQKQMINLKWVPQKNSRQCSMMCKDAYLAMAQSDCGTKGGQQNRMSVTGSIDVGCGKFSYEVTGEGVPTKPVMPKATCLKSRWNAPRGKKEIEQSGTTGTSVDEAYEEFCQKHHGKEVHIGDWNVYDRWGFSEWSVPDRHSFWLRANFKERRGCTNKGKISYGDCIAVFEQGIETCKGGEGGAYTSGLWGQAEEGNGEKSCVEYALEIGDSIHEGSPPWNEHVVKFPPPSQFGMMKATDQSQPICRYHTKHAKKQEIEDMIEEYCNRDSFVERVQRGDFFFSSWDGVNQYNNPEWCNGFDNNKVYKDDCKYAMRAGFNGCNPDFTEGIITGWDWDYRCRYYRAT